MSRRFNPKDSAAAIRAFASKVYRRCRAAGASTLSLEDIEQELWIAWCKACDAYDPSHGAAFSTFLHRGMQLHINRYVEQQVSRRHSEVIAVSLDGSADEETGPLSDAVPDAAPSPEQLTIETDAYTRVLERLSERARIFVTLLHDQPQELVSEVTRLEQKAEFAKSRGLSFATAHRLTQPMVFDLMNANRIERAGIIAEIERVTRRVA